MRSKLAVNAALALSFIALSLPDVTRIPIHEWWSFAFCLIVALHLLLSWSWIIGVTRRILGTLRGEVRFNYVWDVILYTTLAVVMVSGVLISEVALPQLGIPYRPDRFWRVMHALSSDAMLVMVGVHLAMHWDWVSTAVGRLMRRSLARPASPPNAVAWWIRPTGMIAMSALVLSTMTLALGFTPQADRVRSQGRTPRPAPSKPPPARMPAPLPPGAETRETAPGVAGPLVEAPTSRARVVAQSPPRVSLRIRLLRGGRLLAIYMGLPFVATLAVLGLRQRLGRGTLAGRDPLDQWAA